jgi:hypothetical protein
MPRNNKNAYDDIVSRAVITPELQSFLTVLRPRDGVVHVICQHGAVFSFMVEQHQSENLSNLVQTDSNHNRTVLMTGEADYVNAMLDRLFNSFSLKDKKRHLIRDVALVSVFILGVVMGVGLNREYIASNVSAKPAMSLSLPSGLPNMAPLANLTPPAREQIPTFSSPEKPVELPNRPIIAPVAQAPVVPVVTPSEALSPDQKALLDQNVAETNRISVILAKIKDALDKKMPVDPAWLTQLPQVISERLRTVPAVKEGLDRFSAQSTSSGVTANMPAVEPSFTPETPSGSPLVIPSTDKYGIPTTPPEGSSILNSRTRIVLPTPGGGDGVNSLRDLSKFGLKP